ncbi:Leucine Rich Repeat [Dyadobacter soli]|uniref:Leucine Rich Repeat n=1 Tax=Dyadobacter soli TaxID=659014 RepID=A0A1G7Z5M7_9BACT|nr:leucine-rich repeat domain-containing protein [Dyadobacter soli]SDH04051.1 Leucine Rich Repeat [Dyadobacter soli]
MKIFLTVFLVVTGLNLLAQPVVLVQKDVSKELARKLEREYPTIEGQVREKPHSVQTKFEKAYEQVLQTDKFKDYTIWNTLCLNAEGKIDYLMLTVTRGFRVADGKQKEDTSVADSLAAIISTRIAPHLADFVSRRTVGSQMSMEVYVSFYTRAITKPHTKKDSVVNGLAEALATKDSLKVKTLGLAQNLLTTLPQVIYRFPNLEELFLSDNDIESIDLDMARLPKLRYLDLSKNILRDNSIRIGKNKSLQLLNLQSNLITNIPRAARSCKKLETLWLGNNRMTGLTNASFRKLKPVKDINFYKAELTALPKGIGKMRRLEVLDVYYNKLEALPKSITKLKRLTHFAVSHNNITELPKRIDKLKRVHTLYAHHNHLSKLPDRITRMKELRIVDLGYNWLTTFPSQLVAFTNLQELDLSGNNFPDFPVQLLQIRKLDKLHLRGNPFLGQDAERKYSEQLSQLKQKNIEVFY